MGGAQIIACCGATEYLPKTGDVDPNATEPNMKELYEDPHPPIDRSIHDPDELQSCRLAIAKRFSQTLGECMQMHGAHPAKLQGSIEGEGN